MSDDPQYSSGGDSGSNKRKYEDQSAPPPRRPTGFSAPIIAAPSDSTAPSYNSVAPPADEIQLAKQRAQEIAARLFNNASAAGAAPPVEAKRPRFENGGGYDSGDSKGYSSGPTDLKSHGSSSIPVFNGFQGSSKKIDVPNGRVGVIIGKGGETIKYLQTQSGAKIQVTRDMDADLNSSTRIVELMGTPEQISKAEQLINDVLAGAETGGQGGGGGSRRVGGQVGGEQFVMKIPNNKVGLVIGKGGETIKSMQGRTGARIQVIPLHLPPGDPSNERTLQIDGTTEQIENAKQLVFEVISENRPRNPSMSGGYQARPPSWGPPGGQQQQQQPGYGYGQPGGYSAPASQYNAQGSYPGYPQQSAGGYASSWDQSTAPPPQQGGAGGGYDYYAQQQNPADSSGGYGYPASAYPQQGQGYSQDGYGAYQAQSQQPQSGYGYEQQQGYGAAAAGPTDPQPPAGSAPTPNANPSQPSPNPASYPSQQGYGAPVSSQAGGGYGAGYGAAGQKQGYGQATQSPTTAVGGGYGQQAGYSQAGGYGQPESGSQRGYGGPPPYGGPSGSQPGYGQAQAPHYGGYGSGGYAQPPPEYSADGGAAAPPPAQAAKKSPQS